ncbi:hypothetical protein IWQ56_003742 [Coemansia nantahalensis]|uniref:Uncharacterized protein n=2 Tax=Coemansia TaxID=4863 RepID=A0ACC1LIB6_9FUNG|nr:hypothetical protein IWQ56_003742 [Coemansia nantahalensis]KAJ2770028.1 hypothetical protein IWQ57_002844 [Coemansia nantahalensis]KAJ2808168.1 hypothetical protein H4R21_000184 [Coemansia helicoidea]
MALAAGAAVTIPALSALGTIAYYAKHPSDDGKGQQTQRRTSFLSAESDREFIVDDDPSDFSSFSSSPDIHRRLSLTDWRTPAITPDHNLLVDPQLQVWRDRYKWGRNYGMNFAHNDS